MTHQLMTAGLGLYLGASVMLGVAWALFHSVLAGIKLFDWDAAVAMRARVRFGRALLVVGTVTWPLVGILPRHHALPAASSLWRDAIFRVDGGGDAGAPAPAAHAAKVADAKNASLPFLDAVMALLLAAAMVELAFFARDRIRLGRAFRGALPLRRIGRVRLVVMAQVPVPFAVRLNGQALIALPPSILTSRDRLAVALRHEGQHHRHGDTIWLRALALLPALFPLNPFARLWRRTFHELHELACDEAMVGHRRLDARVYGRCLVEAAEAALAWRTSLPGTASMVPTNSARAGRAGRTSLERRLAMFSRHQIFGTGHGRRSVRRRVMQSMFAAGATLGIVSIAYAAQGSRPHAPLTMEAAKALAATIETPADFPLSVDDLVLARLNRVITDPTRAASLRDSLERMKAIRPSIDAALGRFGLPSVLLAVPLVESGYRNLPQTQQVTKDGGPYGAGIWMFIRETGRRYGLTINDTVDDRLDVEKETDAALRLLRDERLVFDDWFLALAAYNVGEKAVNDAIKRGATRDAWDLVEMGQLNDYLVLTMAGIILMHHPELID